MASIVKKERLAPTASCTPMGAASKLRYRLESFVGTTVQKGKSTMKAVILCAERHTPDPVTDYA
jgi:hypothetical protein